MTKVGFIITPLSSGHAVRGVGFYTRLLLSHLNTFAGEYGVEIHEISSPLPGYDLIHYPFFDPFMHTLPFKKLSPTVVTIHDLIPLEFPQHYPPGIRGVINLTLQRLALSNVVGVITDSYASVNSIHKYLDFPHSKIKLIYLAAADIYQPKKPSSSVIKRYSLPKKYILYVGDVNWNKNLSTLLKACISTNIDLVLVGKHSNLIETMDVSHPELKHLVNLKKLLTSPLIHRLGYVPDDDLVGIYNLATLYCQPSFAEGFGLPILEAMACGIPVVTSNTHSLPEIAGDAAMYFEPHDEFQLATIITKVCNDVKLQRLLSQKGLIQAKKFSWNITAQNTLLAYRNLLPTHHTL